MIPAPLTDLKFLNELAKVLQELQIGGTGLNFGNHVFFSSLRRNLDVQRPEAGCVIAHSEILALGRKRLRDF